MTEILIKKAYSFDDDDDDSVLFLDPNLFSYSAFQCNVTTA